MCESFDCQTNCPYQHWDSGVLQKESCSTLHHVSFKQKCIRIILNQKGIGRFQWYYDSTKSSKIWIGKGCVSPFGEFFFHHFFFSFADLLSISSWTTCWFVDEHMIPTTILTQKRNSDSPKRGSIGPASRQLLKRRSRNWERNRWRRWSFSRSTHAVS